MNAGMNTGNSSGAIGFLKGEGVVPQIVLAIVIAVVLYILMMALESLYRSFMAVEGTRVDLLPFTVSSTDKPRVFEQNPAIKGSKTIPLSDNERTGVEFSYSFYIWINPNSFRSEDGLLHIMHKGNPVPFPLMAPGVFLRSNTNTLRVYMNSSKTWNNYIDVENLPVSKWVHVVILARANALEIYINGNLTKKLNMDGATLYQNFGNIYLFSQRPCIINPSTTPSVGDDILQIYGPYSGNLSNLLYFSYALSYTEIQSIGMAGPSKKTETSSMDQPPYLQDSWWTTNYTS